MKELLKKNLLLKRRNIRGTLLELLFPVYFGLILVLISVTSKTSVGQLSATPTSPQPVINPLPLSTLCNNRTLCNLAIVPNSPLVNNYMTRASNDLKQAGVLVTFFNTTSQLVAAMTLQNDSAPFLAGLYGGGGADSESVHVVGPSLSRDPSVAMSLLLGSILSPLNQGQFPFRFFPRPSTQLRIPTQKSVLWSAYFPFVLYFVMIGMVVSIVTEQQKGLRTSLSLAGVSDASFIASWMLTQTIIGLVGTLALILMLVASGGVLFVSFAELLALFVPLVLCFNAMGLFLSIFFENGRNASAFGFLFLLIGEGCVFLISLVVIPLQLPVAALRAIVIVLSVFNPIIPFGLAAHAFGAAEDAGQTPDWLLGYFPPLWSVVVMLLDALLYASLAIIIPLIQRSGWRSLFTASDRRKLRHRRSPSQQHLLMMEEPRQGIEIAGLVKDFGGPAPVVSNVTLRVQPGEVAVLCGPNGAGKSTLLGLLTGQLKPSAGSISVNGSPLIENMDAIRASMGVCPQGDILWEDLTVEEHLSMVAGLKKIPKDSYQELVRQVRLDQHLNVLSKNLSGGQKRKLCLALAMLGNRKVLLLDEPCSGVDQRSACEIQQLITEYSKMHPACTVLLTTHEMSEAEALGSTIIFLKKGKLRAMGSVVELTEYFNIGYSISFAPNAKVEEVVKQFFPHAIRSVSPVTQDFVFKLGRDTSMFQEFFRELDATEFKYGFVAGSLHEVFMRINDSEEDEEVNQRDGNNNNNVN